MITDTKKKIVTYIQIHKQARVHDLVREFGLSRVAIHKQLKNLIASGTVAKMGKPPFVFYVLAEKKHEAKVVVPSEIKKVIDEHYLYISPTGELTYGFAGFTRWVEGIKEEKNLVTLASEYVKTVGQMNRYAISEDWIDATEKIKSTFKDIYVDKLLYADFYSMPKFGKTKLGQLVLYAKQSQNRRLIQEIGVLIKPLIEEIIGKFHIEVVAYIPPTVPRNMQFINEFDTILSLPLPQIELVKISSGQVVVAQKTLARLEERITNARETIFTKINKISYTNVLLIDDAAGSGASFNETAKKLRSLMARKGRIVAFAIVGSFKGFDVIREV